MPVGRGLFINEQESWNDPSKARNVIGLNSLIPSKFDDITMTYVVVANGTRQIQTAVYRTGGSGGTIVGTLTLTYDANSDMTNVSRT